MYLDTLKFESVHHVNRQQEIDALKEQAKSYGLTFTEYMIFRIADKVENGSIDISGTVETV